LQSYFGHGSNRLSGVKWRSLGEDAGNWRNLG
jgi:hypothetical protein